MNEGSALKIENEDSIRKKDESFKIIAKQPDYVPRKQLFEDQIILHEPGFIKPDWLRKSW